MKLKKGYLKEISKIRLKKFFYKLKKVITLEKVTAMLLSIMSIVISAVGLKIQSTSEEIAQKELEILENDREASFVVELDEELESYETENDFGSISNYTVYNVGGRMSSAYLVPNSYIYVYIQQDVDEQQDGSDVLWLEDKVYRINIPKFCFVDSGSYEWYNTETKTFKFSILDTHMLKRFIETLEHSVDLFFGDGFSVDATRVNTVEINYCSYQNIDKNVTYKVNGTALEFLSESEVNTEHINYILEDYDSYDTYKIASLIYEDFKKISE